ncbi:hypothetical protein KKG16_05330, partial [Patescibacteria group bacterium]|nr:hypothetical protein [Patescibacteria group bacterium]
MENTIQGMDEALDVLMMPRKRRNEAAQISTGRSSSRKRMARTFNPAGAEVFEERQMLSGNPLIVDTFDDGVGDNWNMEGKVSVADGQMVMGDLAHVYSKDVIEATEESPLHLEMDVRFPVCNDYSYIRIDTRTTDNVNAPNKVMILILSDNRGGDRIEIMASEGGKGTGSECMKFRIDPEVDYRVIIDDDGNNVNVRFFEKANTGNSTELSRNTSAASPKDKQRIGMFTKEGATVDNVSGGYPATVVETTTSPVVEEPIVGPVQTITVPVEDPSEKSVPVTTSTAISNVIKDDFSKPGNNWNYKSGASIEDGKLMLSSGSHVYSKEIITSENLHWEADVMFPSSRKWMYVRFTVGTTENLNSEDNVAVQIFYGDKSDRMEIMPRANGKGLGSANLKTKFTPDIPYHVTIVYSGGVLEASIEEKDNPENRYELSKETDTFSPTDLQRLSMYTHICDGSKRIGIDNV